MATLLHLYMLNISRRKGIRRNSACPLLTAQAPEFTMHRRYDKIFKAKVAVEALKGDKTLQEITTQYEVHPKLIAQ